MIIFGSQKCWIVATNLPFKVITKGKCDKSNGVCKLTSSNQQTTIPQLFIIKENVETTLLHKHLGHINYQALHVISQISHSRGMLYIPTISQFYDKCILGKQHKEHAHCLEDPNTL